MARFSLLTSALAASIAFGAVLPAMAQDAPPPSPNASLRLDFGMGRKVHIDCGELALAACIEAAKPAIDKVADAPLPPMARPEMGRPGKGHPHGAKDRGPKGDSEPHDHKAPPPPPEAEADTPPAN